MTAAPDTHYAPDQVRRALKRLPYRTHLKSHAFDVDKRPRSRRRDPNPYEELMCTDADLMHALAMLPERRRQSIIGHIVYGRSQRAVGNELGVSQTTVSRDCDVGLEEMAQALGWQEPEPALP